MTSFSPTGPEFPLAAALSQMLENIEVELAHGKRNAKHAERLRWRAELIRRLLKLRSITEPTET
jgi:hypothetical protein